MNKINKIKVGRLYYIAEQIRKEVTDEAEIETIDRTEDLLYELNQMILEHEIIIMNINSKMRLGKSTLAMAIGEHIFKLLQTHNFRDKKDKFGMKNIARDQQEFSKMMRDPKLEFNVIVTDESNSLEQTGENITVENALARVFSDVQAGRYVHRICCSPKETTDENADILLSVIGIDKHKKETLCKLYYKYYEGGCEHTMPLGYVKFPVGNVIKVWDEKVKKHFLKPNKTKEDEAIIERCAENDYYTKYMIKKYEKMNLITKEGIFKPRTLDYAETILAVVEELKDLANEPRLLNKDIIRNFVKMKMREAKIPQSIVGEKLTTDEVSGILDIYKAVHQIKKKQKALEKKQENPRTEMLLKDYQIETQKLIKVRGKIVKALELQIQELNHYKEVNDRYHS